MRFAAAHLSAAIKATWKRGGDGAQRQIRTADTTIFNRVLYQLSYPGISTGANSSPAFVGSGPMAKRWVIGKWFWRALVAKSRLAGLSP